MYVNIYTLKYVKYMLKYVNTRYSSCWVCTPAFRSSHQIFLSKSVHNSPSPISASSSSCKGQSTHPAKSRSTCFLHTCNAVSLEGNKRYLNSVVSQLAQSLGKNDSPSSEGRLPPSHSHDGSLAAPKHGSWVPQKTSNTQ